MADSVLNLGEPADESDWRALVEKGLKGAGWDKLTGATPGGAPIAPLYREPDAPSATDVSGFPGAAPFIRGARMRDAARPWLIRQIYDHPSPERTNCDILADLEGGVSSIELRTQSEPNSRGVRIERAADFDMALADVLLDAAPIALDAGARGLWVADLLLAKLRGAAGAGVAFNIDPIGVLMRTGAMPGDDPAKAAGFAAALRQTMPAATALRVDARPVHESGGTEDQELGAALASGIHYVRALVAAGMSVDEAGGALLFTVAVGPDVLVETAKLRALRACWARVMEAFGASAAAGGARVHAVTSRRMLTRYDAYGNILRATTATFAAAIGGAEAITTLPFTDALGLPSPFARRVARNTQHVIMEEAHAGHVADPAGGAWFVERLTRELAERGWALMQEIESKGGIVNALGSLTQAVGDARAARDKRFAMRRETITGVTDYPLLGAEAPAFEPFEEAPAADGALTPIRWAQPFEMLRDAMEKRSPRPSIFFANLGAVAEFSPRALYAQNLFATGGVGALGPDTAHGSLEALVEAFKTSGARVAVIAGTDERYADHAANTARALKQASADWVVLAGRPGEREAAWREAGVDQFVFVGRDAVEELKTLHQALGVSP